MGDPVGKERRKYARLAMDDLISFAPLDQTQLLGVSKDISATGIRFEAVGCEIEIGEVLRITFNVEDQTLEGIGRVVWSTEVDALTLDIGIEFISIEPEFQRILMELTETLSDP